MRKDVCGFFWDDRPPPKVTKEKVKRTPPERVWERPDYLPGLDEALAFARTPVMTDGELMELYFARETFIYDIEIYKNYFLVAFKGWRSKKVVYLEMFAGQSIDCQKYLWIMKNFRTVGFNSRNFDNTLSALAIAGAKVEHLKEATDLMIMQDWSPWDVLGYYKVKKLWIDHIDVQEVAPGFGSLKLYGGRMHMPKLQDLPFAPHLALTAEQAAIVRFYCINDLDTTMALFDAVQEQIHLREIMGEKYNLDLRSRSDAQIAEDVIKHEMAQLLGGTPPRPIVEVGKLYYYRAPKFLQFQTPLLQSVFKVIIESQFRVGEDGRVKQPVSMNGLKFTINKTTYQMGIGGLHSCEECMEHIVGEDEVLEEGDVTSYYPICIINQNLYPEHLGPKFIQIFVSIVESRIAAKHAHDVKTASTLKIVINGSYGKFGSPYSVLYAPNLIIQTTLTGQLSLLMLIEMLEINGITVVSANTDGIVLRYKACDKPQVRQIMKWWEGVSGFNLEYTQYKRINSANVNNYIAIKPDGSSKRKGWFGETGLSKNCEGEIVMDAIVRNLSDGVPISKTIYECTDLTKFLCVRTVKGGACQDGVPLGKVVRWYYSTEEQPEIIYINTGGRVAKTAGGKPLMNLPNEMPADIDRDAYVALAEKLYGKLTGAA